MKKKIEQFLKFNKQKVIIALMYALFLSVTGKFLFQYNLSIEDTNMFLLNLVYPVEYLQRLIFAPFFELNKISNGGIYKLLVILFSSSFMLFFKSLYYYLVASFVFFLKTKLFPKKQTS